MNARMEILIVDPDGRIAPAVEAIFRGKGWRSAVAREWVGSLATAMATLPDAIVIDGAGSTGEAMHLCQRLKDLPLLASIPVIFVENEPPPSWLLDGLPADAFTRTPFEPEELVHHVEVLVGEPDDTGELDDLTNWPRRRAILAELERRLVARELFGVGLVTLQDAGRCRQEHGRSGLDQFVVLASVVLRRQATGGTPVSVGHLGDGSFLILGAPSVVHHLVAQTIRDVEGLVFACDAIDGLFGDPDGSTEAADRVRLQGSVCLVEPGRYGNVLQIGFMLGEAVTEGRAALHLATARPAARQPLPLVAD